MLVALKQTFVSDDSKKKIYISVVLSHFVADNVQLRVHHSL